MYGIYCTEARGHEAARGLRSCIPSVCDITILYPIGTATMDTIRKLEFLKRKTRQAYIT